MVVLSDVAAVEVHLLPKGAVSLQKSGKNLIEIMKELQDAVNVADNVALAHSAVEEVKSTVAQLAKAARHVDSGDLHLALALINDARRSNDLCTHLSIYVAQLSTLHAPKTGFRCRAPFRYYP